MYRLPVPKNNNFGQILTFGGLLYLTPFTDDEGQIWYSRADLTQSLHLHAKCNLNALILSASIGQNRNFGQILISRGSCTDPLLPMRAKFGALQQTNGVRLRAKFRIDQFILSPSGGEKPQFLPNFRLRHSVVSPVGSNVRKLNTGAQCTTTDLPLSNGIKIVSVFQRLHGEIRAHKL